MPGICTDDQFLFVIGRSLDNSLRLCTLAATAWVLIDVRVHAIARGFGHGRVELWAEDGTLLATASQSCVVRPRPRP